MQFLKKIFAAFFLMTSISAHAATFVYVSNNEDGTIGTYTLQADGSLKPGELVQAAGKVVMPMTVSPDKRYLVAAVRSKPFVAHAYSIDRASGALKSLGTGPLHESFPYLQFDRTGRFLLGASYGANLVTVNPFNDGRVGEPMQVIPTARNAHAIITDNTNRFVFVPHLGTDQVFQFLFDAKTGRLTANTPPVVQMKTGSGPRHIVVSSDNRFAYLLNELTATVTTLALDAKTGLLSEMGSVSALPADSKLVPGGPRPTPGRNVDNDIWASDLHLTPNGRFLYAAERTSSSIGAFSVDGATGTLKYLGSTPTEKQPRGFAIDPTGRTMIVSGEKSEMLATYAIDANGGLKPVGRYPTGKGSNWVTIVSFD
jgi:6-phosphogluconolactonase